MRGKDNLLGGTRSPLAVTGLGILSAAGRGMAPIMDALDARRSFLARLPAERRGLRTGGPLTGTVPDEAIPAGSRPDAAGNDAGRTVRLASTALRDATAAAWASGSRVRPERAGVALGTALGAVEDVAAAVSAGVDDLSFAVFGDRIVEQASDHGTRGSGRLDGPRSMFSATCVSGLCALEQAAADIALDRADAMAVGGIDTLSDAMLAGFTSLGIVSGSGPLRPFDGSHDGIAIGEAACFVVIEPLAEVWALRR